MSSHKCGCVCDEKLLLVSLIKIMICVFCSLTPSCCCNPPVAMSREHSQIMKRFRSAQKVLIHTYWFHCDISPYYNYYSVFLCGAIVVPRRGISLVLFLMVGFLITASYFISTGQVFLEQTNSVVIVYLGICKIYEEHLRQVHPHSPSITYDISELFKFVDNLFDLSCLV